MCEDGKHNKILDAVMTTVYVMATGALPPDNILYDDNFNSASKTPAFMDACPNGPNVMALFWLIFVFGEDFDKVCCWVLLFACHVFPPQH